MLLLLCALLLPAGAAGDADYPAAAGYVNDLTGTLPDAVQQALELRVRAYERATSNEVAVAVVPSLQGQSVEEFAKGLFQSWKVGKAGLNNGVLFLWAPSERKLRIEVGYGLENSLTEAECAQILSQATGLFRQGDYSAGVRTVVDGIIQQLSEAGSKPPPAATETHRGTGDVSGILLLGGIALLAIALGVMHYHTSRVHYLQQEVPAALARAAESLREAGSQRAQATADLEALRAEAPSEVWEAQATSLASSPGHLDTLRQELDRIQSERKEEYREWNAAHRALRRWTHTLEKQTDLFAAIGATLKQFQESRDAAVERIAGLPALLLQMNDRLTEAGDERNRQLLQAAQENFDKAGELRRNPPVNWLLACDLLNDAQGCLDCLGVLMDPEADTKQKRSAILACRQTRYWAGSGTESPASGQMLALMTVWNNQNPTYDASASSGSSGGSGSFDSGGGGSFGGGDTGGSGASAGY